MRFMFGLAWILLLAGECFCKPQDTPKPKATPWHGPHTASPASAAPSNGETSPWPSGAVAPTTLARMTIVSGQPKLPGAPSPLALLPPSPFFSPKFSIHSSANLSVFATGPSNGTATFRPHTTGNSTASNLPTFAPRPTPRPDYNCRAPYDIGLPTFTSGGTCVNYNQVHTETSTVNCAGCPPPKSTSRPATTGVPGGLFSPGPFVFPVGCGAIEIQPVVTITAIRCMTTANSSSVITGGNSSSKFRPALF